MIVPGDIVARVREAALNGRPASLRGLWVSFLSAYGLEAALHHASGGVDAGWGVDWICLDLQHGDLDVTDLSGLMRVAELARATTFVRPPSHDAGTIVRVLDAGAAGLIVPTVESGIQARALVDAVRLPPRGRRSSGSARTALAAGIGSPDPLLLLMVETANGLAAADEIASTDGVDGVFVGPYDLTLSLGAVSPGDEQVQNAIRSVVEVTRRHRKVMGMYAGRPDLLGLASLMDIIAVDSDVTALRAGIDTLFDPPTS